MKGGVSCAKPVVADVERREGRTSEAVVERGRVADGLGVERLHRDVVIHRQVL